MRIKGERGIYTVKQHEFNPRNGKHWLLLVGGPVGATAWRHKHPMDVTLVKRGATLV